jgi:type 1 glutamine amidotransferase
VFQGALLTKRRKYITDFGRQNLREVSSYDRYVSIKRIASVGVFLLLVTALCRAAGPIPVMLLDGESAGPYHAWKLTTPVLKRELDETGLFQVDVVTAPSSGASSDAQKGFNPEFTRYQAVVFNYDAPDWPAALKDSFERYMKSGGGLVIVHAADNAFPGWKQYNEMIGVGGWRNRTEAAGPYWFIKDGKLVRNYSPGPAGSHGARLPFQVTNRAPEHPIMKGLPAIWMHQGDELYATLRGPGENMTVLATAHSEPSNNGTGRDEPMLMALNYGKGRIFHTTMGHDVSALSCVGFIATFQRGTEWAATGRVTQTVPKDFPGIADVSYRADIAAMTMPGTNKPATNK